MQAMATASGDWRTADGEERKPECRPFFVDENRRLPQMACSGPFAWTRLIAAVAGRMFCRMQIDPEDV
jgi:hypothetical protein